MRKRPLNIGAIDVAGLCCEDVRRAPVADTSPSGAYIAGGLRWGLLLKWRVPSLGFLQSERGRFGKFKRRNALFAAV